MSETPNPAAMTAEVDKNMIVGKPDADGLVWYNVKNAPFDIYGLYMPQAEGDFRRMPDDVAAATNNGVKRNARHTAGGRVRFQRIRAALPCASKCPM